MKREIVEKGLGIYSKIRYSIEGFMFRNFSQKGIEFRRDKWELAKDMNIVGFENYINDFEYKSDKWGGLLDMSFPVEEPGYFFSDLKWGRDCDDYARIWALYLKLHGWEEVTEVIVTNNKKPFRLAHVVTVAKKYGKYSLFNYEKYGSFNTFEDAVDYMAAWKDYPKENLVWIKYLEH